MIDACLYICYLFDGIPIIITGESITGISCKILGGFIFFMVTANMTLVPTIALITYFSVCHNFFIPLGRNDWKLHCFVIACPLITGGIGIQSFGPDIYWCYTSRNHLTLAWVTTILYFGTLVICGFCYFSVINFVTDTKRKVARGQRRNISSSSPLSAPTVSEEKRRLEKRIIMKICSYVLMFMLNWGPAMPYTVGYLTGYDNYWVYVCTMCGLWFGGTLNGIQYAVNEGVWAPQKISDDDINQEQKEDAIEIFCENLELGQDTTRGVDGSVLNALESA